MTNPRINPEFIRMAELTAFATIKEIRVNPGKPVPEPEEVPFWCNYINGGGGFGGDEAPDVVHALNATGSLDCQILYA